MNPIALSLGSNREYEYCGEKLSPHNILQKAIKDLQKIISKTYVSSLYITKPMYYEDQDDFHNMVMYGSYHGNVKELLIKTQEIERTFGRNRSNEVKNGPRSLDIDILFFSDLEVNEETIVVPHPKMTERAFVLVPLLEIYPVSADSRKREYYVQCLKKLDSTEVIRKTSL